MTTVGPVPALTVNDVSSLASVASWFRWVAWTSNVSAPVPPSSSTASISPNETGAAPSRATVAVSPAAPEGDPAVGGAAVAVNVWALASSRSSKTIFW